MKEEDGSILDKNFIASKLNNLNILNVTTLEIIESIDFIDSGMAGKITITIKFKADLVMEKVDLVFSPNAVSFNPEFSLVPKT